MPADISLAIKVCENYSEITYVLLFSTVNTQCISVVYNLVFFLTLAHCPRHSQHVNRPSARGEDFTVLTSEVLKRRLQALNLPIVGSRGQLLARLKLTLPVKPTRPPNLQKRHTTKVKTHQLGQPMRKSTTNRTDEDLQPVWPPRSTKTKTAPSRTTSCFLLWRR